MAKSVRCSFTLPAETADQLAAIAARLGISRSALVAELLSDTLGAMQLLIDVLPPGKVHRLSEDEVRRFRGASIDLIRKAVAEAQEAARDIDPEAKLL